MVSLIKFAAMRAASLGLGFALNPVGMLVLIAGGALLAYTAWESHTYGRGAADERAAWEAGKVEAQNHAVLQRERIEAERDSMAALEDAREAELQANEKRIRDENPGDDVLWRDDDGWLQSKRGGKAAGR